ncbi:uncharacterized protein BYT42DRAFT_56109 [Radiomyces spectabilis]|uniref:uncharacterized protein n=1 Tax=Radiomyces spectabilis TaxID=64574 RepID=UPI00221F9CC1|nr:uncharacterized protein BYT42DRAFT_56109 [Radiomyces spectabilis]KAI8373031.1 hypothetical protein BYT42DRAFT_56109 [Radiomyces spectabilis]
MHLSSTKIVKNNRAAGPPHAMFFPFFIPLFPSFLFSFPFCISLFHLATQSTLSFLIILNVLIIINAKRTSCTK